jgi:hypothetical protein
VLQKKQMPGLSMIPSHIILVGAELELVGVEDREGRLLHRV